MKWNRIFNDGRGHSLYECEGQVALADQSIRVPGDPTTTDDGLLIVNLKDPISIGKYGTAYLNLFDAQGNPTRAFASDRIIGFFAEYKPKQKLDKKRIDNSKPVDLSFPVINCLTY